MSSKRGSQDVLATMASAVELTEQALGQVARIAIEQIHDGVETGTHVEAAERDMRSALRQLVLAERELHSRSTPRRAPADSPPGVVGLGHAVALGERDSGNVS
ncbi:MAG TPA: hypothetical protein VMD09_07970 [Solirubrobacteraceae bacterium]|nr:hypothetical protein [Solirubrobacteraceae bacterium]